MTIRKIDFSDPKQVDGYLNIPISEIRQLHKEIISAYELYLRDYGVKRLWKNNFSDADSDDEFIAKVDAKQFIFDEEYFMNFGGMDDAAYKQGFEGITTDTWTGEQAIIATATMTSNAIKQSTTDAFESFATIKNGGAQ